MSIFYVNRTSVQHVNPRKPRDPAADHGVGKHHAGLGPPAPHACARAAHNLDHPDHRGSCGERTGPVHRVPVRRTLRHQHLHHQPGIGGSSFSTDRGSHYGGQLHHAHLGLRGRDVQILHIYHIRK